MWCLRLALPLVLLNGCDLGLDPAALPTGPVAQVDPKEPAPSDELYIEMMVSHHKSGIELAAIGFERVVHEELRDLAARTASIQTEEIAKLEGRRDLWFGSEGPSGTAEAAEVPVEQIVLDTVVPFDLAFLDVLIAHHQGAVQLATTAAD